jgi:surface polysaccharide O-acyltransferase-like enzyme
MPSATPATLPGKTARNALLDTCRIGASVAILWMHTWQSAHLPHLGEVGRFGVPFFTCSAFYLLMQSFLIRSDRPFLPYLKNRIVRLYLPFLAWGALGLGMMIFKHRFISHQPMDPIDLGFFLTGASFQLWYLPFLLIFSVIFFPLCKSLAKSGGTTHLLTTVILTIAAIAVALAPPVPPPQPASVFPQGIIFAALATNALPSALLGIALALMLRQDRVAAWAGITGLMITIVGCIAIEWTGRDTLLETATGIGLLLFALCGIGGTIARALSPYAFLAYGIYLSQNIVLETTQSLLTRAGVRPSNATEIGVFIFVLAGTTILSLLLRRSKTTRWMLG